MGGISKKDKASAERIRALIGDLWEQKVVSVQDVKILINALDSSDANLRSGAVLALGNIFSGEHKTAIMDSTARMLEKLSVDRIEELKEKDESGEVRRDAADVLQKISRGKPWQADSKKMSKREPIKPPHRKALPMKSG